MLGLGRRCGELECLGFGAVQRRHRCLGRKWPGLLGPWRREGRLRIWLGGRRIPRHSGLSAAFGPWYRRLVVVRVPYKEA